MAVRNEVAAQEEFGPRYARAGLPAAAAIERAALGTDFGANGYTTLAQADQLSAELGIGPDDRLLDIGAGCGWPGLHITQSTGCRAVISDLTESGMRRALDRAREDATIDRVHAVAASARNLPFRPECFDVIVHTDVLC